MTLVTKINDENKPAYVFLPVAPIWVMFLLTLLASTLCAPAVEHTQKHANSQSDTRHWSVQSVTNFHLSERYAHWIIRVSWCRFYYFIYCSTINDTKRFFYFGVALIVIWFRCRVRARWQQHTAFHSSSSSAQQLDLGKFVWRPVHIATQTVDRFTSCSVRVSMDESIQQFSALNF